MARYLQDWTEGLSQLDPEMLKDAVAKGEPLQSAPAGVVREYRELHNDTRNCPHAQTLQAPFHNLPGCNAQFAWLQDRLLTRARDCLHCQACSKQVRNAHMHVQAR